MPRPKFVAGNWKMMTTRAQAGDLARAVAALPASTTKVAVCPPFVWLATVADALTGSAVELGGQNCYPEPEGAFTGETSPRMLAELGCKWVIVGHSERRVLIKEGDEFLNRKAKAALAAGLGVIFCVGELLSEREAGHTESVLDTQLTRGLLDLTAEQLANLVVAYEPVWAIGTGKVATPEQAQAAHAFIRAKVRVMAGDAAADKLPIQYGGSVKPQNARELLALPDVDGALVGGASLDAGQFATIVAAAG